MHFMFNMGSRWLQVFLPWRPVLDHSVACRWLLWAPLSNAPQTFCCENVHVCRSKPLPSSEGYGRIIHFVFFFFFFFYVLKWQFEISMTNVQLAIFFRSSSIVLRQCVIPAAQTLVNSHATGNVSGSSTVTHGSDFTLLIILSPAIIIVLVTKVVTIRASMYISGFLHYLKFKTKFDFFFFF